MAIESLETRQLMASQVLTQYPIPSAGTVAPAKIALASDGSLWFTENNTPPATLGRITTSGALTQYSDPNAPGDVTFGITQGPDANLYTTEQGATPAVAQVIPSATNPIFIDYTNFALAGTHNLNSITSGPQGDNTFVWFTDSGGSFNAIGQINITGAPNQVIPEFTVANNRIVGTEITPGPAGDNGLYFIETVVGGSQSFIGRIDDTTHVITEFPLTNSTDVPVQLSAGPGDSIYFTEQNGQIGQLKLATGVVNDNFFAIPPVTLPGGSSPTPVSPTAIAQFPDGSLYITESGIGSIARLALGSNGAVTGFFQYNSFPSVTGLLPGISPDRAGDVWFTESGTDRIATLTIPIAPLQAQPVAINGTVNQPLTNIPVATFTDPDGPSSSTQYQATINWGDGTPLDASTTISPTGPSGAFQVLASHTYTTAGRFTATVTITDLASPRTATVFDAASISVSPVGPAGTITATAGTPFLGTTPVATFPVNPATPGAYSATIDWGDGTALGGATITGPTLVGGVLTDSIIGTHTFSLPGTFNGSVTLRNPDGSLTVFPLHSVVSTLSPDGVGTLGETATAGTALVPSAVPLVELATAAGSPNPVAANYSATINWGDGSAVTVAQVVGNGPTLQIFPGSHTYSAPGTYPISYILSDDGAPSLATGSYNSVVSGFHASSSALSETAGTPIAQALGLTLAPLLANSPAPNPASYSATIDYGDGTPLVQGHVGNGGAGLTIFVPTHTYASPGGYLITYTLADAGTPTLVSETAYFVGVGTLTGTPIVESGVVGQPVGPGSPIPLVTATGTNAPLQAGYYSATIDYGDGSPTSVGTILTNANGTLTIDGPSHTYQAPGNYHVNILIGTTGQPNLALLTSLISVTEAPITVNGILNPTSDSGISNSDAITNDVTPNFFGNTAPGATVRIYATPSGNPAAPSLLIGQAVANSAGAYSVNSIPLADGRYDIEAIATSKFGTQTATTLIESGNHPLVIDTAGPKITGFKVSNTLKGQFQVAFQDELSGLVFTQLVNGSNYDVQRPVPKPLPGQHFTIASLSGTPGATPTSPVTVTGSVFNGHYLVLRGGVFVFTINASGITDVAGNALDGEFYGTFPTGDGHPGGNFKAEVIIRQYTPSGPIPFSTANPAHPGVAAISPTALAPKLKKPGLNAPPTSLPGVNIGQPLSTTSIHQKVVTKNSKAKAVVAKAKEVVAKVVVKAKAVAAVKQHKA